MAGGSVTRNSQLTIGLLGGSFNPAHAGHRHISIAALKALRLDAIWWVVSKQNPLKSSQDTLPFSIRLQQAKNISCHPKIKVTDIETKVSSLYTIDTLKYLKKRFPNIHFIWIMGADNLVQFPEWYKWREIMQLMPIMIYDRDSHIYKGLTGKMAISYKKHRITGRNIHVLGRYLPPAWGVMRIRKHPLSSTLIRQQQYKR